MFRYVRFLAVLFAMLPPARIMAIDVCLVNDSDRVAIITILSGKERIERQLPPKCREFISLPDSKHDRLVIAQSIGDAGVGDEASIKVIGTKLLTGESDRRWNFCYVHGSEAEGVDLDLLGFVCLDVVPLEWGKEPSADRYTRVRSQLIQSLKETRESQPDPGTGLRKALWMFTGE